MKKAKYVELIANLHHLVLVQNCLIDISHDVQQRVAHTEQAFDQAAHLCS